MLLNVRYGAKRLVAALVVLNVSGCVTGYQSYGLTGGYKDKELGNDKYTVEYFGNGSTSPELVLERWHQRAKELCPDGYNVLAKNVGKYGGTTAVMAKTIYVPISASHPWVTGSIQCKQNTSESP